MRSAKLRQRQHKNRKLQADISDEYTHNNSQQNADNPTSTTH